MLKGREKLIKSIDDMDNFRAVHDRLVENAYSGVLPSLVSKRGSKGEDLTEVMYCDTISGGARYKNEMPMELVLVRELADGTEYRQCYVQGDMEGGE